MAHYHKRGNEIPEILDRLENMGCPHTEQSYTLYRDMREYHIMPFCGNATEYPAWFADDMLYFALVDELANLPYHIRDIQKSIQNVKKPGSQ